jgi:hypothetical protein
VCAEVFWSSHGIHQLQNFRIFMLIEQLLLILSQHLVKRFLVWILAIWNGLITACWVFNHWENDSLVQIRILLFFVRISE